MVDHEHDGRVRRGRRGRIGRNSHRGQHDDHRTDASDDHANDLNDERNGERDMPDAGIRQTGQSGQAAAWRALHTEGILWDGPVAVADGENQLPLRLIATVDRLAFAKGGEFVLEIPREWLTPPPHMNPDGSISLTVDSGEGARPERIRLLARDGRRLAVDLIAALNKSGRTRPERPVPLQSPEPAVVRPEQLDRPDRFEQAASPEWSEQPERVSAGERRSGAPPVDARGEAHALAALDQDDFPPYREVSPPAGTSELSGDVALVPAAMDGELAPPVFMSDRSVPPREADWSLQPIASMSTRTDRLARRGWAIRLSGLIALLVIAAAFGSGRMPSLPGRDIAGHIPNTSIEAPFAGGETDPTAAATSTSTTVDGTLAQANTPTATVQSIPDARPTQPPSETAVALGVGGMESTGTVDAIPTPEPTATATAAPTETATVTAIPTATATATETDEEPVESAEASDPSEPEPTATLDPTATTEPTATAEPPTATNEPTATTEPTASTEPTATLEPTAEPTQQPTETPTVTPSETQMTEPAAAPTVEPTSEATAVPTVEPTVGPTETAAPTETPTPEPTATSTATVEPSPTATPTATTRPSFPSQGATLAEGELPAQTFAGGELRYTVESVERAKQIDALALTPVNGFEWVAVLLHAENWSEDDVPFAVANHQLLTYGAYGVAGVAADPVTKVIAQNVGLDPALGIADTTTLDPGDGLRLVLVYLIRPDTTLLQLTTGQTTIDLTPALGSAVPITDPGPEPEAPELMEVTVVEVLDGQSILVQSEDGARTRVRYLGVQAPVGNVCYANKSKSANAKLVDGETVYLERERKNRAPNSRIARDVWIEDTDGNLTLVAAELAAGGSVVAAPVEPDVRFAGWIQAAADGAVFNNVGLWGACGGLQTPEPEPVGNVPAERVILVPQNEQVILPIGLT